MEKNSENDIKMYSGGNQIRLDYISHLPLRASQACPLAHVGQDRCSAGTIQNSYTEADFAAQSFQIYPHMIPTGAKKNQASRQNWQII